MKAEELELESKKFYLAAVVRGDSITVACEFVRESNRIEGIQRAPSEAEIGEFLRFMRLERVTVEEMERFVKVYQPDAELRDKPGLNVRVGNHIPIKGGPPVRQKLEFILLGAEFEDPYFTHIQYETLHPFTDGNGRSGRMLWAWQMKRFPLGFLHHFYYQTLQHSNRR